MRKTANLKLKLHRETLRALTSTELTNVEGGLTTGTKPCSVASCVTDCGATCNRRTC